MIAALRFLAERRDRPELAMVPAIEELVPVLLTPRFQTSAHVVHLLVTRAGGYPVLVVKASRRPATGGFSLAREAAALAAAHRVAGRHRACIPRLVAYEEWHGTELLVETAVPGRVLRPSEVRRRPGRYAAALEAWVTDLHIASAHRAHSPGIRWTNLLDPLERDPALPPGDRALVTRTRDLTAVLDEATFPRVLEHGDLSAPNILVADDGTLGIVDWEPASPDGLPLADLAFALAFVAFARAGATGRHADISPFVDAFFAGRRAWAWASLQRYATAIGLDPALIPPLFLACWSQSVIRRFERIDRADGGAGDRAARWARVRHNRAFALWGHTVRHFDQLVARANVDDRGLVVAGGIP